MHVMLPAFRSVGPWAVSDNVATGSVLDKSLYWQRASWPNRTEALAAGAQCTCPQAANVCLQGGKKEAELLSFALSHLGKNFTNAVPPIVSNSVPRAFVSLIICFSSEMYLLWPSFWVAGGWL